MMKKPKSAMNELKFAFNSDLTTTDLTKQIDNDINEIKSMLYNYLYTRKKHENRRKSLN